MRAVLEAEAAGLAALRAGRNGSATAAGPDQLARLRQVCAEGAAAAAAGDLDAMVAASTLLHQCVSELSGNPVLLEFVAEVEHRVGEHYPALIRHRGAEAWREHQALADAIIAGDGELAARLMRQHVENTRQAWHQLAQPVSAVTTPRHAREGADHRRPAPVPARRRRSAHRA